MNSLFAGLPRPFLVLAPMDDVTDTVFRQVITNTAPADLFFTEFVNVDALQSKGRESAIKKLKFSPQEKPLIAQIWGKVPKNFYQSAQEIVEMGFDGVDINMGCPDKTIVKNGCCGALIKNQELASEIIDAVKNGVNNRLPVSVKTRIGFANYDEDWLKFLFAKKLKMLSIHFRTVKEMSKVPARWDLAEKIVSLKNDISPDTTLVGNGDVLSRAGAEEIAEKYNLDGIMIGRGVFSDPFVFAKQSEWNSFAPEKRIALFKEHVELFDSTWQGNERKIQTLNKFCKVYISDFDGSKELRARLMQTKTTDEILQILGEQVN